MDLTDPLLSWTQNYQENRMLFCTKVNREYGNWEVSASEILQGTLVGPPLFSILINELLC